MRARVEFAERGVGRPDAWNEELVFQLPESGLAVLTWYPRP